MKAKYQIYKITLHSGEIYIGQHKGNVLTDGYIGSPSGQNGCNSYSLEDIARIEVLDFANRKKDIDHLEIEYIEYYRKTFGVSSRIVKEYNWLLKYFKLGICLNISRGYSLMDYKKEQKYKDYFKDKLIVQCDKDWNFLELFECLEDVLCKTKASGTCNFYRCFREERLLAYNSRWFLIQRDEVNNLSNIILKKQERCKDRLKKNLTKKSNMIDVYTETNIYIGRFYSIHEAMRKLNLPNSHPIRLCLSGQAKSAYGYIFKLVKKHETIKYNNKKVNQYDKFHNYITTHNSIAAATRTIPGAKQQNISACCNGKRKSAYGYIWEFAEELSELGISTDMYDKDLNYIRTFDSLISVCKELGYEAQSSIVKCCKGKRALCHNYTFRYHDPVLAKKYEKQCNEIYLKYLKERENRMINLYDRYRNFVGLFDTSITVANYIGLKTGDHILRCCKGLQKSVKGYYCEFASDEMKKKYNVSY